MTKPKNIIDTTLVPHKAFDNASNRLDQCFLHATETSEPVCIAILGESRTGKTRVLEECCRRRPPIRQPTGLIVPILRVKTPSKPSVKGLVELMLYALGDPLYEKGTENAKTIRLLKLMRLCKTVMVIIDEFQHFYDKVSHKVQHHVADWLKILVDDAGVALVVAGLPSCKAVIEQNEQLAGRFLAPLVMPRFDWQLNESREEFIAILGAFHEALTPHFELPDLDSPEMAFRCYYATGGLIGYLTKFLRQLVWNAQDKKQSVLSLADLQNAHDEAVWHGMGFAEELSPFARDFSIRPSSAILERARHLGAAVPPPVSPKRPKASALEKLKSRDVLSAT